MSNLLFYSLSITHKVTIELRTKFHKHKLSAVKKSAIDVFVSFRQFREYLEFVLHNLHPS